MTALLSRRAYARHRGTSVESVRRAIAAKRLDRALVVDAKGQTLINPAVADAEWTQNETVAQVQGRVNGAARQTPDVPRPVRLIPHEQVSVCRFREQGGFIVLAIGPDDLDGCQVFPLSPDVALQLGVALIQRARES